jgi:hypothetical protein
VPDVEAVWHYANWRLMPKVVADGYLRPVDTTLAAGMPLVWFTVDQRWDRTSTDDVLGSVRFGLNATDARLLPWRQVFIDTGVDPAEFIATVERTGADRNEWFAVFGPVTLGDLTFEVLLDESGDWADSLVHDGAAWKPADPVTIAREYLADEARARAERDAGA